MLTLAMAVLVASLVGSLHCIGMCGPLALWVTSGGSSRMTILSYHFGRLTTYMVAAVAAGLLGAAVSFGGDMVGFQSAAAKLAGSLLIAIGILRLMQLHPRLASWFSIRSGPSMVAAVLQKAKPLLERRGASGKAFLGGFLTTWLPCGWLYLFVLVAAGTGSVLSSIVVMVSFWIGTLPALTTMLVGIHSLTPKLRSVLPVGAALLLIATGLYTVTGRAAVDVSTVVGPPMSGPLSAASLVKLKDEPLPCCAQPVADVSAKASSDGGKKPACCADVVTAESDAAQKVKPAE